jgi:hypothetical protein
VLTVPGGGGLKVRHRNDAGFSAAVSDAPPLRGAERRKAIVTAAVFGLSKTVLHIAVSNSKINEAIGVFRDVFS